MREDVKRFNFRPSVLCLGNFTILMSALGEVRVKTGRDADNGNMFAKLMQS